MAAKRSKTLTTVPTIVSGSILGWRESRLDLRWGWLGTNIYPLHGGGPSVAPHVAKSRL